MRLAEGPTILQNASARGLTCAHLCYPSSPTAQLQLTVVLHQSGLCPLCFLQMDCLWQSDLGDTRPLRPLCLDHVRLNPDISSIVSLSSSPN